MRRDRMSEGVEQGQVGRSSAGGSGSSATGNAVTILVGEVDDPLLGLCAEPLIDSHDDPSGCDSLIARDWVATGSSAGSGHGTSPPEPSLSRRSSDASKI